MNKFMDISIARMARNILRRSVALSGLIVATIVPTACAAVDDIERSGAGRTGKIIAARTEPEARTYAYEIPASEMRGVSAGMDRPNPRYGSSPWICSPSGFGQKSTCSAR